MKISGKPWYRKEKKTWYVQIDRKQVRLSKDKAEAMRKWRKLMAEGRTPNDQWLDACVEHYLPTLAPKSRRTREQVLTAFQKHTGPIKVSKLDQGACPAVHQAHLVGFDHAVGDQNHPRLPQSGGQGRADRRQSGQGHRETGLGTPGAGSDGR